MDTRQSWADNSIQSEFQTITEKINAFRITFHRTDKNDKVFQTIHDVLEDLKGLLYPDPEQLPENVTPADVPVNAEGLLTASKNGLLYQLIELSKYKTGKEKSEEFDSQRIMLASQLGTFAARCLVEISYKRMLIKKKLEHINQEPFTSELQIPTYSDTKSSSSSSNKEDPESKEIYPVSSDNEEMTEFAAKDNPQTSVLLEVEEEEIPKQVSYNTDNIIEFSIDNETKNQTSAFEQIFPNKMMYTSREEIVSQLTAFKAIAVTNPENKLLLEEIKKLENRLELMDMRGKRTPDKEKLSQTISLFRNPPEREVTCLSSVKRTVNRKPVLFSVGAAFTFISLGMCLVLLYDRFVNKPYGKMLNGLFHTDKTHLDNVTLLTMGFFLFGLELMTIAAIRANCKPCAPCPTSKPEDDRVPYTAISTIDETEERKVSYPLNEDQPEQNQDVETYAPRMGRSIGYV